jgi:hypothetical protein
MTHASIASRPVPQSLEVERSAYNAAFYELGLGWHWSADTFESLQATADHCERIRRYMEQQHPHLLRAYEAEFLAEAIEARRAELLSREDGRTPSEGRNAQVVETKVAQTGF